jgi:hypothetical protein
MPRRPLVIDVKKDLPRRSTPLSEETLSQIFGGCIALWTDCSQNSQCCSYFCNKMWWISSQQRWEYQCLPESSRYN